MSFAHPLIALAAGVAVAIPILIHLLLRFRRRPVQWAAMRFLYEAYQKQRRKLRLQQLLLLAARCLLLLAAGVAIARPFAGSAGDAGGPADVYLLIDNSLTAQLRDDNDTRALNRHIAAAQGVIDELGPGDRVALAPLAGPALSAVLPPSGDTGGVRSLVGSLQSVDAPPDVEGALSRVRAAIDASSGTTSRVIVFSEFRRGFFPAAETASRVFEDEMGVSARLVGHASGDAHNVQVAEVEPQRSMLFGDGERETVRVRLRRFGPMLDAESTTVVRAAYALEGGGGAPVDAGRASVRWAPGQGEQDVFLSVQSPVEDTALGALVVTIDRDRLAGDDSWAAPLAVAEGARVGVIDRPAIARSAGAPLSPSRWLELALQPDRSSHLQPVTLDPSDLDRTALAGLDGVFVLRPDLLSIDGWDALRDFVARGRGVTVFPPASLDAHPWAETAVERLGLRVTLGAEKNDYEDGLSLVVSQESGGASLRMLGSELEELIAPVRVFAALSMRVEPADGETVLSTNDGTPWVVRAKAGNEGEVVLFASALSLEWSTLAATPLMVPLMQEMVRESAGAAVRKRVTLAGTPPVLPPGVAELEPIAGGDPLLVGETGAWSPVLRAGVYRMRGAQGEDLGPATVAPFARAGDTRATVLDEAVSWFGASGLRVDGPEGDTGEGAQTATASGVGRLGVSSAILFAALALAVAETLMARRFSPAGSRR